MTAASAIAVLAGCQTLPAVQEDLAEGKLLRKGKKNYIKVVNG